MAETRASVMVELESLTATLRDQMEKLNDRARGEVDTALKKVKTKVTRMVRAMLTSHPIEPPPPCLPSAGAQAEWFSRIPLPRPPGCCARRPGRTARLIPPV